VILADGHKGHQDAILGDIFFVSIVLLRVLRDHMIWDTTNIAG
jgi:hypothetical protein